MKLRQTNIDKLKTETFDVLVVGGGINGAVSAAALAGKGAKVGLIERQDFASCTSSNSSNLAWGGIKYLENMELLLVNKLCKSRNHLMKSYPSTVQEIRFFTTIQNGFRLPVSFVFLGTLFYWMIGRFFTKPPRFLTKATIKKLEPVVNTQQAKGGFEYSDCYLYDNDARFVFNFIRNSLNYGCVAANYVESTALKRDNGLWQITAKDTLTGEHFPIRAKVLINACGPYVDQHNSMARLQTNHHHVFSKGIHLIIDQVTSNKRVLTFFASDGRLFFVIPMGPKTCIGTTDTQVAEPKAQVTEADRQFVIDNINALLVLPKPITPQDIIAERCGVRPLAIEGTSGKADWVKLSRKHAIDVDSQQKHLSIFGGKLTDCLNVGEEVVNLVAGMGIPIPYPKFSWYGEPNDEIKQEFLHQAKLMELDSLTHPSSSEPLTTRFWRRYGAHAFGLLERIRSDPSNAQLLIENAEYTRCEIEQAAQREVIVKLEDFLRRRSKIALVVRKEDLQKAPGLKAACKILFGDQAEQKYNEYFTEH
ncbi:glycerol-3-phosphate dehydrogenase/oxidase [Ketobacter sp. MCCC 1A13808]|uniref:glycerol-3-phosphate dehydrogenase/oxidase n=1 Tax=Ketobacter sp. MCCC 1A13808 TaxID=2602738 RepID=UPI0012EC56D4|nr:glycerol-3-phosphate dehydrogenase/oxidase [Ketobacter sp. MCCC 1A13808]MVF12150.1 glycerol-3-phosphate dehydrogenase/oxidase [Ketobacter sp. MCCC 1A13808]